MSLGSLYIVATPIGNLSDMTIRAVDILKSVDWIAAEDTRHSHRLLSHYDINTPTFSLHEHNEDERIDKIMGLLNDKKSVALISDAGTPLISDPGFRLVRAVFESQHKVVSIPGACAAISALVVSGFPTDRFVFEGFLPAKTAALESYCETLKEETRTLIFYESVHRIVKTLCALKKIMGDERRVTIARELTKTFETIKQDTLVNICEWVANHPEQQKGEYVIVLKGAEKEKDHSQSTASLKILLQQLLSELSIKQSVSLACKISGENRNTVYALALELKDGSNGL